VRSAPAGGARLQLTPTLCLELLPVGADNYALLLLDDETRAALLVDSPAPGPVLAQLELSGHRLVAVLNTHHHGDHIGANAGLRAATGCALWGAAADAHRIPGLDRQLREGDEVWLGAHPFQIWEIPGHTAGHIAAVSAELALCFCGDTLFFAGCGRRFEGEAPTQWASQQRLAALPPATRLACAHEYSAANLRWARGLMPDDPALAAAEVEVQAARAAGRPTVPTTVGAELRHNLFLRAAEPAVAAAVGCAGRPPVEVFAALRAHKDTA
jgi:hydroxyacylglutathione hydrolase